MQLAAVGGITMMTASLVLCRDNLQKSADVDEWKQLQCTGASVSGKYANYAQGFSVRIPREFVGRRGQAAGPERGVSVPLSPNCEGVVVIFGQPNSLEWPTPEDAISWEVAHATKKDPRVTVARYASRLGSLRAAGVTLRFQGTTDVDDVVVAFRPGGGPIYFAGLRTVAARYERDREVFNRVIRSFRLEPWR